jgi:hypothetical protein
MNTQNNKQDKFIDLLVATSQDDDSHKIRTHLKNRLEDQEVVDAVIDYASTLAQLQPRTGKPTNYGDRPFTKGKEIPPQSQPGEPRNYGDSPFTDGKG